MRSILHALMYVELRCNYHINSRLVANELQCCKGSDVYMTCPTRCGVGHSCQKMGILLPTRTPVLHYPPEHFQSLSPLPPREL